jgi:hypothetical protein
LRQELTCALNAVKESQEKRLAENALQLQQDVESFGKRLLEFSDASQKGASLARAELSTALKDLKDSLQKQMNDMANFQKLQLDSFSTQLINVTEKNERKSDELRTVYGELLISPSHRHVTMLHALPCLASRLAV